MKQIFRAAFLFPLVLSANSEFNVTVYGPQDSFFRAILHTCEGSIPSLSGHIENWSNDQWEYATFQLTLTGRGGQTATDTFKVDFEAFYASLPNAHKVFSTCSAIERATVAFLHGRSATIDARPADVRAAEAAQLAHDQAVARAAAERLEAERIARLKYLNSLPLVTSEYTVTFVASDRKCAADFLSASKAGGLTLRKQISELVSYGCGFTSDQFLRVTIISRDATFALIEIADGRHEGKRGWISLDWFVQNFRR